jgi:tRNA A-37 threonylcarbamoyl transferase component Bud32
VDELGHVEGKYQVLEKIKEGGMGAIYKVRHRLLDEVRVIKTMRPQFEADEGLRARFLREARTIIKLRHSNIAQIYDFTVDEKGNAFIVMEYIDGIALDELARRIGQIPLGSCLEVSRQALAALGYLHKRGIVHRDISPDNLMITRDDDNCLVVKLIDLGIAKVLTETSGLTTVGTFLGKARYSSPEQFQGGSVVPIDTRSDIYSLGVVLYEVLTGRLPFPGETLPALITGHIHNPPLAFEKTDPDGRVPVRLRAVVLKALEKKPVDRFQSADEMAEAITGLQKKYPCSMAEIDRAFVMEVEATERIYVPDHGSFQDQLDQQFAAEAGGQRTPTGGSAHSGGKSAVKQATGRGGDGRPTVIDSASGRGKAVGTARAKVPAPTPAEQVRTFMAGAAKLFELGQLEEARQQLQAVLTIDAEHAEAASLLGRIESSLAVRSGGGTRTDAIGRIVALVEDMVADGRTREALAALEQAESELGSAKELARLRATLEGRPDPEQLAAMLRQAEELVAAGKLTEAIELARSAGEDGANQEEVSAVIERAEEARRKRKEEEARARQRHEALSLIERTLESGDLEGAEQLLGTSVARFGEAPEIDALRQRLAEAHEGERRQGLLAQLREAKGLVARERFEEAIAVLEKALEENAGDDGLIMALATTKEAQVRWQEERERKLQCAERAKVIVGQGESGDLEGALEALAAVRAELGDADELAAAERRLIELAEIAREREVKGILAEAAEHVEAHRYSEAIECLERASQLAPHDQVIPTILTKTRQAFREYQAEQQRDEEVRSTCRSVEKLLGEGDIVRAQTQLAEANKSWGPDSRLDELSHKLAARQAKEREAQVQSLLRAATASIEGFDFAVGIAKIEEALTLDPNALHLQALLEKAREAEREHLRAEQRRRERLDAIGGVDELITAGRLERAEQRLAVVERKHGTSRELDGVRQRLQAALSSQRQTEAQVEDALSSARSLIAIQDYARALELLNQAAALAPGNTEVQALVSETEQAQHKQAVERRRVQEIGKATAVIEGSIKAGNLGEAKRALMLAERLFGAEPVVRSLRHRIEKLENQQRRVAIEASIEEARSLADSGHFEKATLLLQQAKAVDSGDEEVAGLLHDMPRRQARATVERYIEAGQIAEASRALQLAEKLYGKGDPLLAPLRAQIDRSRGR